MIYHYLIKDKKGGAETVVKNYVKLLPIKSVVKYTSINPWKAAFENRKNIDQKDLHLIHSLRDFASLCLFLNNVHFFIHFRYPYIKRLVIIWLAKISKSKLVFVGYPGKSAFEKMGWIGGLFFHNFVVNEKRCKHVSFGSKRIIWLGAIKEGKNWEHIFEVAELLKHDNYTFDIYGPVMQVNSFEKLLAVSSNVYYKGVTSDSLSVLSSDYDCCLYTAYNKYEMAPMVLLECLAVGIPIACYYSSVNRFYFEEPRQLPTFGDYEAMASLIINGGTNIRTPDRSGHNILHYFKSLGYE